MMPNSQLSREPLERSLFRVLTQIPTIFGRLVYLASLRNSDSGRYSHHLLNGVLDFEECDRVLCHSHHQVFSRWLTFCLEEQKKDLEEYLNSAGVSETVLNYPDLIPRSSREVERQLYITDLETVLELLRLEQSADFRLQAT
jgi:hypothetical protein